MASRPYSLMASHGLSTSGPMSDRPYSLTNNPTNQFPPHTIMSGGTNPPYKTGRPNHLALSTGLKAPKPG